MSFVLNSIFVAAAFLTPLTVHADQDDVNPAWISACDTGVVLGAQERRDLLNKLRISNAGQLVLADFIREYATLANLVIQWDSVSYSQVANAKSHIESSRAPAGLGEAICVHLARALPAIEHVADLAHELRHATRLEMRVLKGEMDDVDEFVHARLAAPGGEADAFATECQVKRELLGDWDSFCAPYVKGEGSRQEMSTEAVLRDFYNGKLSASLTGQPYPVMLGNQFRSMLEKRHKADRYSAVKSAAIAQ